MVMMIMMMMMMTMLVIIVIIIIIIIIIIIYIHAYIYTCLLLLILMLWRRQAIFESRETSCFPLLNAGFEPKVSGTESPADWMPTDKPTKLSGIKLKTWTQ